jgi:hypothetical protein
MIVQHALRAQMGNLLFIIQAFVVPSEVKRETLSPVVSDVFMEHFEEMALDTDDLKPARWLRFVDTFVVLAKWANKIATNFSLLYEFTNLPQNWQWRWKFLSWTSSLRKLVLSSPRKCIGNIPMQDVISLIFLFGKN